MNIEIITQKDLLRTVADRWKRQYYSPKNGWGNLMAAQKSEDVHRLLEAEGRKITPEAAERIIGNKSWTSILCESCDSYVNNAIAFGYEMKTRVCLRCAQMGVDALTREEERG